MKKLYFETGGRPIALDDFDVLQEEVYNAAFAALRDAPPMVLSGCAVTQTSGNTIDITGGWLWINNSIYLFEGVVGAVFPLELVLGGNEYTDYRAYQTGGSKPCMSQWQVVVQPSGTAPAGTHRLKFHPTPNYTYAKWIESLSRAIGEVQFLANVDLSRYDGTGRGWENRETAGWAICNGQNGTADLRERFIVGMNPAGNGYTVGATGGSATVQLEVPHLPAHSHGMEQAGSHTHNIGRGEEPTVPAPR